MISKVALSSDGEGAYGGDQGYSSVARLLKLRHVDLG